MRMVVLALMLAALAGCNTMRGVGQDVERAGQVIQREARR